MALELTVRHGTVRTPLLVVPTPDFKTRYHRQNSSDTQLSPTDSRRKNKRKLSEPRRRTTDFSIKRLCPDSPGSACSESGQSEESTPERLHDESHDSIEGSTSPTDLSIDKDTLLQHHPHMRPPFVYPEMHHPYLISPFCYGRLPGFPSPVGSVPGFPDVGGLPTVHSVPKHPVHQQHSRQSSQDSCTQSPRRPSSPSPAAAPARHVQKRKEKESSFTEPSPRAQSPAPTHDEDEASNSPCSPKDNKKCRKNYKNMTRERRVEANARERTRVHTISAAFEGLRRAVPSYSYNQKLSKLAILRIACSYINALSKLADPEGENPQLINTSFAECVDNCTRTIQTEGKARRRH